MQIEICALCDHEKYATALISPIRHVSEVAEKYGFYAICAHIKKIIWFLDSWKQCEFDRTNQNHQNASHGWETERFCTSL